MNGESKQQCNPRVSIDRARVSFSTRGDAIEASIWTDGNIDLAIEIGLRVAAKLGYNCVIVI